MEVGSEESFNKYTKKELIGTGSNGNRVYKVLNNIDNKHYAMKKILINTNEVDKYINEINIFKDLNHPNIIKFYESFIRNDKLFIIMEYAQKGDLKSLIKKQIEKDYEYLEESLILKWFTEIASAVKCLHSKKIIHRDIKLENIFISSDENVKVGDFGISKALENSMDLAQSGVGTPYYLSPEICQGLKYNFKTDIWMMGCLLYELSSLKRPFKSESIKVLIQNIISIEPEPLNNSKYSENLINLISIMLRKNAEERPTIDEVWEKLTNSKVKTLKINHRTLYKSIDKNKLKIEIEEKNSEFESININTCKNNENGKNSLTPISQINLEFKDKLHFNHKAILTEKNVDKKFTPSHCKNDINKIMKKLKISPMNTPTTLAKDTVLSDSKRRTSSTTTDSTPTHFTNMISNYNNKINNKSPNFKKGKDNISSNRHYRHISINISSMQSPEHNAVYEIENIEKVEELEFPSPINNTKRNTYSNNKPILTPTNQFKSNKISPKEVKETPFTTKVGKSSNEDGVLRRSLIKNFLIERYGNEKFEILYNEILNTNKIDEKKIMEIVGEDHKVAVNYLKYLTGKKN